MTEYCTDILQEIQRPACGYVAYFNDFTRNEENILIFYTVYTDYCV